jgi:hypothetical protein
MSKANAADLAHAWSRGGCWGGGGGMWWWGGGSAGG